MSLSAPPVFQCVLCRRVVELQSGDYVPAFTLAGKFLCDACDELLAARRWTQHWESLWVKWAKMHETEGA